MNCYRKIYYCLFVLITIKPIDLFCQQQFSNDPHQNPKELFEIGYEFYTRDQFLQAIDHFEKAIKLKGDYVTALYFNALAHDKILDYPEAIINLETCLQVTPEFPEALFSLAVIRFKKGDYDVAIKDFKKLLLMDHGETQAIYFKGIRYGENNDDIMFNQVMTMYNQSADIHDYLGLCYYKIGNYPESIQEFDISIALNENDDNVWINRAISNMEWGNKDAAIQDLKQALSINPYNSIAQLNLVILSKQDSSTGIQYLNDLINSDDHLPEAFARRGYLKFIDGDLTGAKADFDSAIILDDDNFDYYLQHGFVCERLKEWESAIKDYSIAMLINPDEDEIYTRMGNVHFKMEAYSKSISYYTMAIEINPENGQAYYNRAICYDNLKNTKEACMDALRAVELGIEEAEIFLSGKCK